MAIGDSESVEVKKSVTQRLIAFFRSKSASENTEVTRNPFQQIGEYGEIPAPKDFKGILYSRLNATQAGIENRELGKVRVYENDVLSIHINTRSVGANGLSENLIDTCYMPMYARIYEVMTKNCNRPDMRNTVKSLNKVSGPFELVLNSDLEQ